MLDSPQTTVFCDAHVHIYGCFDLDLFLDSAYNNFYQQALLLSSETHFFAVLLLSEAKQDHWFARLRESNSPAGNWIFHETSEPDSLVARNGNGHKIFIVNGRQIVTSENLEILGLALNDEIPDGKPIDSVIEWVISHAGIPVIPWGFGKWWGHRGNVLSRALSSFSAGELFLGDNSGRPWFLGKPKHFAIAEKEQRRILPGSDPLPFRSEAWRPGSVGFHFSGAFDEETPTKCMRDNLKHPNTAINSYMHCERTIPFLRNQFAMQIKKRM